MLPRIVIEAEGHDASETTLRLSIDTHLIAENLTAAQDQLLVGEILNRLDVFEVGKALKSIEQLGSQ
jgi:hypothetical protein